MLLDVCLETVFTDLPAEKRIAEIAQAGFTCVEFWFHDSTSGATLAGQAPKNAGALMQACATHGVTINGLVINGPDGTDGRAPVNADDLSRYLERVEVVMDFADRVNCWQGITCAGNIIPSLSRARMRANLENALGRAAELASRRGFTLLLEPLNTRVDHVGYYLDSSREGADVVRAINSPNLRLLYDVYHMQIMEGNIIATIESEMDVIGHFHSAGVPGRHELFGGELNYPEILRRIDAAGYDGCFGLEYSPAGADHGASLRSVREYLQPGPLP